VVVVTVGVCEEEVVEGRGEEEKRLVKRGEKLVSVRGYSRDRSS
jgi:hypothetical protein